MRWLLRRLVFYAFAIWVALTLNFLLPRLMPGDPDRRRAASTSPRPRSRPTPGSSRPTRRCSAAATSRSGTTTSPTCTALAHLELRHLDVELPGVGLRGDRPHAAVLDLPRRRRVPARLRRSARRSGWSRPGGAAARSTPFVVPTFMALGAFPAFFTALLGVYFLGLKLDWFPIQHAYDSELVPGFNWTFLSSALRHSELPILVIVAAYAGGWVLNMRTVMINTIGEDYVAMAHAKGLRDRRVMTRYAGTERDPAAAERLRRAVRERGRRARLHRVRLQLSRRRADAAAGRARQRLPAHAGAAARLRARRDRRELHHGPPQLRPRPARARRADVAAAAHHRAGRSPAHGRAQLASRRIPGWLRCCSATRSRASGSVLVGFMVIVALIAPWISVCDPTRFNLLDDAPGAVVASPVRDHRPGQRHLLAGRARRPPLADPRRRRRRARDGRSRRRSASSPPTRAGSSTSSSTS